MGQAIAFYVLSTLILGFILVNLFLPFRLPHPQRFTLGFFKGCRSKLRGDVASNRGIVVGGKRNEGFADDAPCQRI